MQFVTKLLPRMYHFNAILIKGSRNNGWTYIDVPPVISITFHKPGKIFIRGTVNGCAFRTTFNKKGDGEGFFYVNQSLLKSIQKTAGDMVLVEMKEDEEPGVVHIPDDLSEALSCSDNAKFTFDNFPYSHKKEIIAWINDAKKPETRLRRILKSVTMLEDYTKQKR
jgi:hypothetical protein